MRILEMNYLKFSTLLLLTSLFTVTIHAQTKTEKAALSLNDGTIDNQFEYVIQKSYTYRGNGKIYKNVERHWLYALKAHTLDSLKALKKDLSRLNKLGYKVILFKNEEVYKSLDLVLEAIKQEFK